MVYITVPQNEQLVKQLTFEEMCFGGLDAHNEYRKNLTNNTRTFKTDTVPEKYMARFNVQALINSLALFNSTTASLREVPRASLYRSYKIPKHKGGWRPIDEPTPALMLALDNLSTMFRVEFKALHHTSAFAYAKKRSTYNAVQRHQFNESKWFGKFDLTNFFGSTTLEFAMRMLSMIFPFSEVMKLPQGERELRTAVELGFLNGGLPQGSPFSPGFTNLLMLPFDYEFSRAIRQFNKQTFVYTRYADDMQISSKYEFNTREVEQLIRNTLAMFDAPYTLNNKKTRYGSSAFSNWMLGYQLNAENKITIGHERKHKLAKDLFNYAMDRLSPTPWSYPNIKSLAGDLNYLKHIEPDYAKTLLERISNKCGFDIERAILIDTKA